MKQVTPPVKRKLVFLMQTLQEWLLGPLADGRIELHENAGRLGEGQRKSLLKHRLKKVAGRSDLVPVYKGHRPGIAARETGSAGDFGLTDQVVYALYGLDEDQDGYA